MTDLVHSQHQQDWSSAVPMSLYANAIPPPGVGPVRAAQYPSVKHRRRTSPTQLRVLEDEYKLNPKPDAVRRQNLANELAMRPREVQVWFQNRRAKERKQQKKRDSLSYASDQSVQAQYGLGRRGSLPTFTPLYDSPVPEMYRRRATVPHLMPLDSSLSEQHLHNPAAYTHLPDSSSASSSSSLLPSLHHQPIQQYSFPPPPASHNPAAHPDPHAHQNIFAPPPLAPPPPPPPTSFSSSDFSFWPDPNSPRSNANSTPQQQQHLQLQQPQQQQPPDTSLYPHPSTSSNTPSFSHNLQHNIPSPLPPQSSISPTPQSLSSSTPQPNLQQQNIPQSLSSFGDSNNLISSQSFTT